MSEAKYKIRIEFEKVGKMKYISHLDLLRVMQRLFKRAGVPLWHTEGFNPHPYIAFGQPLSLGHEGLCEIVDTALTVPLSDGDKLCAACNAVAPQGLVLHRAWVSERPLKHILYAAYESVVPGLSEADIPQMESRLQAKSCMVEKKSGREYVPLDILPLIRSVRISPAEGGVRLESVVACGPAKVLNPQYLVDGALGRRGVASYHRRMRLLDESGEKFN